MNKKLIPAMALGMLSVLASCGTSSKTADVFIYQYSDTYIGTVRTALKTDLEGKGITPTFYDAGAVSTTQVQQIEAAIASKSKLLIPNLVEQTATGDSIAKKAKDAGIPAIFFNREVNDSAVTAATYPDNCFVGTDPDQAGYMQGDILAEALISGTTLVSKWDKNGDGKINYIMLRADESNAEANGRTTYSVQECNAKLTEAGLASLNHIGSDYNAGWSKATAKTATDNFISTYGLGTGANNIECVIANNDDMALGAIASLATAGYNVANGTDATKTILVVGVDATQAGKAAIDANQMYGTVKQDADAMASCIASLAANKLDGKDYLAGTDYVWENATVQKVRIPYGKYVKA